MWPSEAEISKIFFHKKSTKNYSSVILFIKFRRKINMFLPFFRFLGISSPTFLYSYISDPFFVEIYTKKIIFLFYFSFEHFWKSNFFKKYKKCALLIGGRVATWLSVRYRFSTFLAFLLFLQNEIDFLEIL